MQTPTRLRILDFLRKQQSASVRELSGALGMTGANVRHHLAMLEANDVIEMIGQRQEGRGRPVNIYGLSRRILGDGLDELAGALLGTWFSDAPPAVQETGLRSLALRLGGENQPGLELHLPRLLNRLVDRLNELHYQARWEAGVDGPRIILGHCPYAAIIAAHPELCLMDAFLLEQRSGLPAQQMAKLQASTKGTPFCAFRVANSR